VFSLPGIGTWMYTGITRRDLPIVQGGVIILALIVLAINVLVDVAYAIANPKVRLP
jgi:dipeptide transport system permease protein